MSERKAYVVGTSVSTSLSPTIFKYWCNKYKINAKYKYIEINEKNFNKEIKLIFKEKGLCGLNITTPYKEKIIPHLTKIDQTAKKIGAVNCITIKKNFIEGTNTDWLGFKNSLNYFQKNKHNKTKKNRAIVIGYGGSAKAIIYSLESLGYKKIMVINRTYEKIKNLKNYCKPNNQKIVFPTTLEKLPTEAPHTNLIINTVPDKDFINKVLKSLYPKKEHHNKGIEPNIVGYDIVYKPETSFLSGFLSYNTIKGIYLLVHQAAPCFYRWFGVKPKIDQDIFKILSQKKRS